MKLTFDFLCALSTGKARAPEAELAAQDPDAEAEEDAEVGDVAGVSRGGGDDSSACD